MKTLFFSTVLTMVVLMLPGCVLTVAPYPPDEVVAVVPPFVEGQSAQLLSWRNVPFNYQLTCNTNVSGNCRFSLLNTPLHGTLDMASGYGQVVYTPDPDFVGEDDFDFQAEIGGMVSERARITIEVDPARHDSGQ